MPLAPYRKTWRRLKTRQQKGAFIVLTALLLPTLVFLTGSVVDLGNIYIHHSYLQNSADAAALGGAKVGWDKSKQKFTQETADAKANELIDANQKRFPIDAGNRKLQYHKSHNNENVHYYTVQLHEDVPLYFWRYFAHLANISDTFPVDAQAYAKISIKGNSGDDPGNDDPSSTFTDLFTYSKKLSAVNTIDNPDNFNFKDRIRTTFDGHATYTQKDAETQYSTQTDKLGCFLTQRAKDEHLSVNEAKSKQSATYNDQGKDTSSGYWSQAEYQSLDLNAYWNTTLNAKAQTIIDARNARDAKEPDQNKRSRQTQNPTEKDFAKTNTLVYDLNKDDRNINLTINNALSGDKNTPVYLIIKAGQNNGLSVLNINLNADTGRPLIITVEPTAMNQWSQIHMNLNGHTFRGIIYAPMMSDEGVLINAQNGTFRGSVVARSINLQGGSGTYIYEPIDGGSSGHGGGGSSTHHGGGSGSGSGKTPKPTVKLTNDASDIDWNS